MGVAQTCKETCHGLLRTNMHTGKRVASLTAYWVSVRIPTPDASSGLVGPTMHACRHDFEQLHRTSSSGITAINPNPPNTPTVPWAKPKPTKYLLLKQPEVAANQHTPPSAFCDRGTSRAQHGSGRVGEVRRVGEMLMADGTGSDLKS